MKKILKIKNNILIKEEEDTFVGLKDITVGAVTDVGKLAKQTADFGKNLFNFFIKNSWYTFRYSILKNMTEEQFKDALKETRINFVSKSERNISQIDQATKSMLQDGGIDESELNTYLLGFPGHGIIESLSMSELLSNRVSKRTNFKSINFGDYDPLELLLYFMYYSFTSNKKLEIKNSDINAFLTNNKKIITFAKPKLKLFLINKISKDIIEVLNKLTKKKDLELLKVCKSIYSNGHEPYKILNTKKATSYITKCKNSLGTYRSKSIIPKKNENKTTLSIKNCMLLIEEITKDEYKIIVGNFMKSLAQSILLFENDNAKIIRAKILSSQLGKINELTVNDEVGLYKFLSINYASNFGLKYQTEGLDKINFENKDQAKKTLEAYKKDYENNTKEMLNLIDKDTQNQFNKLKDDHVKKIDEVINEIKKQSEENTAIEIAKKFYESRIDSLKSEYEKDKETIQNSIEYANKISEKININFLNDNMKKIIEALQNFTIDISNLN